MIRAVLLLIISFLFLNCGDKKNASAETNTSETESKNEETVPETISEENKSKAEDEFVYITNNNVEDFLINYGKENPERKVQLETAHGTIQLELFNTTPLHRANFIYLVKTGYLSTTFFHRAVDDFMIQGGNSDRRETSSMRNKIGNYTIPAEINHKHVRGALSAAKEYRDNPDDRSSSFEFFIVQSPNGAHHLDPNYTVFGKVISGMDVVDKIASLETDDQEWPVQNLFIEATVID